MDTIALGNGSGLHWTAILFWIGVVALAGFGVWFLIRVRTKQAEKKREYLKDNPVTDPHRPRKP